MSFLANLFGGNGRDKDPGRVVSEPWGTYRGTEATLYTISNGGVSASISDLGATLVRLHLPDKDGNVADCVLGYDDASAYEDEEKKGPYFGATVGRVANRTADGKFSLDGKDYTLAVNNGPNSLHGGVEGFSWQFWSATVIDVEGISPAVRFRYVAADMEEGFPGECVAMCTYSVHSDGSLRIQMEATVTGMFRFPTTATTLGMGYKVLYFSDSCGLLRRTLSCQPVQSQLLQLRRARFRKRVGHEAAPQLRPLHPRDRRVFLQHVTHSCSLSQIFLAPIAIQVQIPTGELRSVKGTPFDFTAPMGQAVPRPRLLDVQHLPPLSTLLSLARVFFAFLTATNKWAKTRARRAHNGRAHRRRGGSRWPRRVGGLRPQLCDQHRRYRREPGNTLPL